MRKICDLRIAEQIVKILPILCSIFVVISLANSLVLKQCKTNDDCFFQHCVKNSGSEFGVCGILAKNLTRLKYQQRNSSSSFVRKIRSKRSLEFNDNQFTNVKASNIKKLQEQNLRTRKSLREFEIGSLAARNPRDEIIEEVVDNRPIVMPPPGVVVEEPSPVILGEKVVPQPQVIEEVVSQPEVIEEVVSQPQVVEEVVSQPEVVEEVVSQPQVIEEVVVKKRSENNILPKEDVIRKTFSEIGNGVRASRHVYNGAGSDVIRKNRQIPNTAYGGTDILGYDTISGMSNGVQFGDDLGKKRSLMFGGSPNAMYDSQRLFAPSTREIGDSEINSPDTIEAAPLASLTGPSGDVHKRSVNIRSILGKSKLSGAKSVRKREGKKSREVIEEVIGPEVVVDEPVVVEDVPFPGPVVEEEVILKKRNKNKNSRQVIEEVVDEPVVVEDVPGPVIEEEEIFVKKRHKDKNSRTVVEEVIGPEVVEPVVVDGPPVVEEVVVKRNNVKKSREVIEEPVIVDEPVVVEDIPGPVVEDVVIKKRNARGNYKRKVGRKSKKSKGKNAETVLIEEEVIVGGQQTTTPGPNSQPVMIELIEEKRMKKNVKKRDGLKHKRKIGKRSKKAKKKETLLIEEDPIEEEIIEPVEEVEVVEEEPAIEEVIIGKRDDGRKFKRKTDRKLKKSKSKKETLLVEENPVVEEIIEPVEEVEVVEEEPAIEEVIIGKRSDGGKFKRRAGRKSKKAKDKKKETLLVEEQPVIEEEIMGSGPVVEVVEEEPTVEEIYVSKRNDGRKFKRRAGRKSKKAKDKKKETLLVEEEEEIVEPGPVIEMVEEPEIEPVVSVVEQPAVEVVEEFATPPVEELYVSKRNDGKKYKRKTGKKSKITKNE